MLNSIQILCINKIYRSKLLVRVHSVAISGALAAPEATTHRLVDDIHESINEHGHSFVFVRVYSKFVKDNVPSCSNVSDVTQE